VQLLGKSDGGIVVGQLASLGALLRGERNAVVDVEDAVAAAGGPDGGGGLDRVLLGVDLAVCEGTAASEGRARGLLFGSWVSSRLFDRGERLERTVLPASWEK
jgi:hypothetical protein